MGKSKIERMEMVSPLIEAGRLWLPLTAPWRASFLKNLLEFPYGVSDDWPDAVSQLLLYLDKVRQWAEFWQNERRPKPVCEVRQPFSNGGLLGSRVNGKIWI